MQNTKPLELKRTALSLYLSSVQLTISQQSMRCGDRDFMVTWPPLMGLVTVNRPR